MNHWSRLSGIRCFLRSTTDCVPAGISTWTTFGHTNSSFMPNLFCKSSMQGMSAGLYVDRKVIITSFLRATPRRGHLSIAEMLVGQVLALLRMDPAYLRRAGRFRSTRPLHLEMFLSRNRLVELLAPRTRGKDAETDNRKIREAIDKAINGFARLEFWSIDDRTTAYFPEVHNAVCRARKGFPETLLSHCKNSSEGRS